MAQTGIALWGRNLGLFSLSVVLLWLFDNIRVRPESVEAAGQYALQHRLTETGITGD